MDLDRPYELPPAGGAPARAVRGAGYHYGNRRLVFPLLAVGSPGGSTITTVLHVLVNRLDQGLTLLEAIAAPRASQRNTPTVTAEPAFRAAFGPALEALGHSFADTAEIGAATGVEFLPDRRLRAVAEPARRGGGSAAVVSP